MPREAMLRQLIAEGAREVLEDGMERAADPDAYLRMAAAEMEGMAIRLAESHPREGAELRAILAEELVAAARRMLRRRMT